MDSKIFEGLCAFEANLYKEEPSLSPLEIIDIDYWVNMIVMFPSIRPHFLDKIVELCSVYCMNTEFKNALLKKSAISTPVLVYRLFKKSAISFQEVSEYFHDDQVFLLCYYFQEEIPDFGSLIDAKEIPEEYFEIASIEPESLKAMFEFGFRPNSLEYCLKYDDLDGMLKLISSTSGINEISAEWSPFEWSFRPKSLDLLSFCAIFGSTKCFKQLLMMGMCVTPEIVESVVCGGSMQLYHLCGISGLNFSDLMINAISFYRLDFLQYFIEQGTSVNYIGYIVYFIYFH